MKDILVFIDWYWPGFKAGGTVRAFQNMVSYLKSEFVFHIVTRDTDYTELEPYASVRSDEWNQLEDNVFVYYASAKNVTVGTWRKLIRETPHEIIYIHGIFSFWFSVLPIFLAKKYGAPKILVAAHGMLGDHAFQVKALKKSIFIRLIKWTGLYKGIEFHAANIEEAEDVRKRAGKRVRVKIAHELPKNEKLRERTPLLKEPGSLSLAWIARIAPEKNLREALLILSGIEDGLVNYDIYGPVYDQDYWTECQGLIRSLPGNIKVLYKGSIPGDQVTETLQKYHCLFLPTSGENFGHAILESMMAGCPVIISDRTPWRELEKNGCGFDLPLQNLSVFCEKIDYLIRADQHYFDQLTRSTLDYIYAYLDSPEALEENIRLFKNTD